MKKKALCILGTASDVGKSVVTTAIGRLLKRRGIDVVPYKAQNMSNNSYVTREGGEMGRAQVVQAEACGVEPHVDMNPVLLKPSTDIRAQLVIQGKAVGNVEAMEYFTGSQEHVIQAAHESLHRLMDQHELVVIEGAGSCAEVNLRKRDIVNFDIAHASDAPVILVADIDRGGVFAQIIGTLAVLSLEDKARVKGFIINRFRGDAKLFEDGVAYLEEQTGLPVLGVIPYYRHIEIDPEDGLELDVLLDPPLEATPTDKIRIAVLRLPHISNFTDVNVLRRDPEVELHYLSKVRDLGSYDLLILPGSKNTLFDMNWLREMGWAEVIQDYVQQAGHVFGVCGGFQMMGKSIKDPAKVESQLGEVEGLGLLDMETEMQNEKHLYLSEAVLTDSELAVKGYEIHMGETTLASHLKPFAQIIKRGEFPCLENDGACSSDGRLRGTYFHGIFDNEGFRESLLQLFDSSYTLVNNQDQHDFKQAQYELLADHFESNLDMKKLLALIL